MADIHISRRVFEWTADIEDTGELAGYLFGEVYTTLKPRSRAAVQYRLMATDIRRRAQEARYMRPNPPNVP